MTTEKDESDAAEPRRRTSRRSQLDRAAEDLQKAATRMDLLGQRLLTISIFNSFITTVLFVLTIANVNVIFPYPVGAGASLVALFSVLTLAAAFDRQARLASAVFEEMSDELQWNVKASFNNASSEADFRPSLEYRRALRGYVISSKPPLVALAYYLALNLLMTALCVWVGVFALQLLKL